MNVFPFIAKIGRKVQLVVGALVLGGALLTVPGGAAHAATADCRSDLAQRKPGVYLFSDINFQGDCQHWTPNYIGNNLGDVGNDRASSMKIIPDGYRTYVSLYQNTNSGGAIWTTSAYGSSDTNIPDFRQHTMTLGKNLNDRVSSISIWDTMF